MAVFSALEKAAGVWGPRRPVAAVGRDGFSESATSAGPDHSEIGPYPRGPRAASEGAKNNCQRRYENQ